MDSQHFIDDVVAQLERLKRTADGALAQVRDDQLFEVACGEGSNSIAIIMKHMAGNMRSRWTDFLTSDGEKPDRGRDGEFEIGEADTAEAVKEAWEAGWNYALGAISALRPADLSRSVTVRGEPHSVIEAVHRQYAHYAYHVGQIVLLARHFAGASWRFLSIPPGKSSQFDVAKDGTPYEVEDRER